MTIGELQWIVGIAVTVILAIGGIAIGAFRAVTGKLDRIASDLGAAIKTGDDMLHERVNRVRQDVSDNYIRRVDHESHMKRLDETLKEMRDDSKAIIRALAKIEAQQEKRSS